MTFLDPFTIGVAAALTLPPLIALYFLKLRRQVRLVPSTLLWKRAVEDLHVNAPFQRLRRNLLLLLQLLVLILAAIALGRPIWQRAETAEDTVILLIDNSASMSVLEEGARTRLDLAKESAKRCIDNLGGDARAMVIAFSDRANVASSFNNDKSALKRQIDSIEQTQSTSSLGEAIALAEAYAQNLIIGGERPGSDIAPESTAPDASVFLFTDGRIEDAKKVNPEKLDMSRMQVTRIGKRDDNVGIVTMDARRDYDRPVLLEVVASVQNFSPQPRTVDVTLYIDGENVDVQTLQLGPGARDADDNAAASIAVDSAKLAVFDRIEFAGGGAVEVVLNLDDALSIDNRAWTVLPPPKRLKVLLVGEGNLFLENVLRTLPLELTLLTPAAYESAPDARLVDGERSPFDVVMFDRVSSARLPRGNYFFWGAVPTLTGLSIGPLIDDQIIFDWDETHPVLRYVAVETIEVSQWFTLALPRDAVSIIDGQTSSLLAHLTRDAGQFLISAFGLIVNDELGGPRMNTDWVASVDFVVFIQNAIDFLASNVVAVGRRGLAPGEPVTLSVPAGTTEIRIQTPSGTTDSVPTAGSDTIHYPRTRSVGLYKVEPAVPGDELFAVNLFNATESNIAPAPVVELGGDGLQPRVAGITVTEPAWPYLLLAILVILLLEWIIYNRRVFA